MTRPPTLVDAGARGLLTAKGEAGIYTFSNGTDWECWAEPNCYSCRFWDPETAGTLCAFEAAALLSMVTPDLARLFGWVQSETKYGPLSGWDAPESCRFFLDRSDDNGDERPLPPEPDPLQLVLLADPTEDAAQLAALVAPSREMAGVA